MARILNVKQFRAGTVLSYGVSDPDSGECVIVDPVSDSAGDYRDFLRISKLRLIGVLETRASGDRQLAADSLRREFDVLSETSPTERGAVRWGGLGEVLMGSSPGSFHGAFGKNYFMGEDWRLGSGMELPAWMEPLEADTLLFPSEERFGILFSTPAVERARVGLEGLEAADRIPEIQVAKIVPKLRERSADILFVDVREVDEFAAGHISGMTNLPLSTLSSSLGELMQARRIYFSCHSGWRSQQAARTLGYLGASDTVNVAGGYHAWLQAGYPVEEP